MSQQWYSVHFNKGEGLYTHFAHCAMRSGLHYHISVRRAHIYNIGPRRAKRNYELLSPFLRTRDFCFREDLQGRLSIL